MVPIPEYAEQSPEEPEDEDFGDAAQSDGGGSTRILPDSSVIRPDTEGKGNSSLGEAV